MNLQVMANVVRTNNEGWTSSVQIPLFFLHDTSIEGALGQVRGVLNPHSEPLEIHFTLYCEEAGIYQAWTFDGEGEKRTA